MTFFSFHQLVDLAVTTDNSEDADFYLREYQYHIPSVYVPSSARINLNFSRKDGPFTAPAGFSFHQHKTLARWAYQLRVSPDQVDIDVIGNKLSVPMVHHMLVHPSLRYLSSNQGVLLLHAGAVTRQDHSLIFTGRGGSGKTTFTSLLLAETDQTWSPHADDYVFLRAGPESLAYLTRSHLYKDLLVWVPGVKNQLSRSERLRLEMYGGLRRFSQDNIKWPVRVDVQQLWPGREICMRASPGAIIILKRSSDRSIPEFHPVAALESTLESLIEMNFYEARHFLTLLQKSGAVTDLAGWLQNWKDSERQILKRLGQSIPLIELELPKSGKVIHQYQKMISDRLKVIVTQG